MEAEAKRLWWELQHAKVPSLGARGQEGGEPTSKTGGGMKHCPGLLRPQSCFLHPKGLSPDFCWRK